MEIKLELLSKGISECVTNSLNKLYIDTNNLIDTAAVNALSEIRDIIQNYELSDFDVVENIVLILEKYNIDCGSRHDF
ncbi:MAG: hypothetical protein PUF72_04970 [Clostridiales bacterium]|nr:hypothetical protein [Clostridiales bacterium]